MSPREKSFSTSSRTSSKSSLADSTTTTTAFEAEESPILTKSRHLVQANGSIVGRQVAEAILPSFPTFCSAIPTTQTTNTTQGNHHQEKQQPQQPQQPQHQPHPALACIDGRMALSHDRVVDFCLNDFGPNLHQLGFGTGHRIALVLPNGPELALALVATAHWACAVPLNANGAVSELEADLRRCGADLVIGPYSGGGGGDASTGTLQPPPLLGQVDERFSVPTAVGGGQDWSAFRFVQESAANMGIPFCGLVPSTTEAGIFRLHPASSSPVPVLKKVPVGLLVDSSLVSIRKDDDLSSLSKKKVTRITNQQPNGHDDEVLVLFTSGTTGNKKLVPHRMGDMLTAATTIALSWDLGPTDINCNLMPLFHVGGIVRQIFSPLVSGGCVICCPSFDPSVFWALLEKDAFSWYYAAPTMHQLILQTGKSDGFIAVDDAHAHDNDDNSSEKKKLTLRMIANAAGGLLPSLAQELMNSFQANILPSYGMTECMPISSPPATYRLDKPGTSGVPVGPEVAILNTTTSQSLTTGEEGPICVRGEPCFRGYGALADDAKPAPDGKQVIANSFLKGGWFNTGDIGYLDEDGYLFITGRSKEVINRGGEIISPMEVEEAVTSHPDVTTCAAFSALHDVMQEVVGIVVVMKTGRPRFDLPTLHQYLGERLAAPKWPQCLVFMNDLPKSHTNKLLRVKLGSRLGLPELSDNMKILERTFEAICPPKGTPLDTSIPTTRVKFSARDVEQRLNAQLVTGTTQELVVVPHPSRPESLVCYLVGIDRNEAIEAAIEALDRYMVPSYFVESSDSVLSSKEGLPVPNMADALASVVQGQPEGSVDPVVRTVQAMFTEMLQLDYLPAPEGNFFHLGGSSMLASQLASRIRKRFGVACNGSEVFQHASSVSMAKLIRQRSDSFTEKTDGDMTLDSSSVGSRGPSDNGAPFESKRLPLRSSPLASLFQLVPMFIVFPIWQVTRYLLFFRMLLWSIDNSPGSRDIGKFVVAYLAFHIVWVTLAPLVFVAIKWIVIGRYRAGRYPIWGSYYLRWWFVDICRKLFLRGVWGSHEQLLNAYYRMLGAKIGSGAKISLECDVAEYDLVTVGENASIEMATLRGFGVDNGAMSLGPVAVEDNASVGWKSVVSPWTSVPEECHLGPVTSSYDVGKAMDSKHALVNRQNLPEPGLLVQVGIGAPITFLVNAFGQIPPLIVLFLMLQIKGDEDEFKTLGDLMKWLCEFERIKYYIGIRVARAVLSPMFYMAAAIFVKRTLIGKFEAGPRDTLNQMELLRHWLASTLFSRKKIQSVTDLVGRHHEYVSKLYRLLGAKVGKRVFWPGHQLVFSGEFDLLEIGDDVVFGSRSAIFFVTQNSCERVILSAGCNVADNCVVLPGSIFGKSAVLGSNSVCPSGWYLPQGSIWLGSKGCEPICLDAGVEVELNGSVMASEIKREALQLTGDASTLTPFGKAFYGKKSNYFVWPLSWIVAFSCTVKILVVMIHTLPLLGAMHSAAVCLYGWKIAEREYDELKYSFSTIYLVWLFMYLWTNLARVCVWIGIELTAKWCLIGKREAGQYNYDTSSYSQRWELYQIIAKVRKFSRLNFLDFFSGTPFMAAYFRWNGGNIGHDCCLYPSGADPFMPEPDLVTMGDRCVVDCASIVCHLNTRGNFELKTIVIEDNCTLRTRSRVQQGVYMEKGSQLLEKSLAMTGEVIEAFSVWQGCPASWWFQYPNEASAEVYNDGDESTMLLRSKTAKYS